jgi:very-short-patch-repair endonuclease
MKALSETKYLGKSVDKGQLEFLVKWNRLGFEFEPNYQVYTEKDLFYIDGYDKEHNVVVEYDSKYHNKTHQKQKDLIRQNKIIDILSRKNSGGITPQINNVRMS